MHLAGLIQEAVRTRCGPRLSAPDVTCACMRACVRAGVCENPITWGLDGSFKVALTNRMWEHFQGRHLGFMFYKIYLDFSLTKRCEEQSPYSISDVGPFGYVVTFLKFHSPPFGLCWVEITPGTITRFIN
jgi:hypothetical protein